MDKKVKYYTDSNSDFIIENYNQAGAFSNFLPGIAGLFGIPMWVFYVNRGQCVCSFGTRSKDAAIMEFMPANRAYQLASSQGFRTFIKIKSKNKKIFYEPFRSHPENGGFESSQKMFVNSYELRLKEIVHNLGLEVEVVYFTIPNETFAGLVRVLNIKNTSRKPIDIELMDGAPLVIPYGASNLFLQKLRRTVEAWMIVENLEKDAPFYRLKVDPRDVSETAFIKEGNFYLSFIGPRGSEKVTGRLPVVVDPEAIFGETTDFSYPVHFVNNADYKVPKSQIAQNKLPCAMSLAPLRIKPGETAKLYSLLGHMNSLERLNALLPRLTKKEFYDVKRKENKLLIQDLQRDIFTSSADKRFDLYCGQTFLDNVLRGGYPITCPDKSHAFYVYSRKHGDLERDYNKFCIDPTYFSQGNGNFRDTNQNRRNDIFFNPDINDSNILHFYSLIQADGFNPLVLHGVRFRLKNKIDFQGIDKLGELLSGEFTPGELFMKMEEQGIKPKKPWRDFLNEILKNCEASYHAEHGEGFWIDHWTYNLDLVEGFLSLYPERLKEILLDKKEFTFYDSYFYVKPRSERCLLNGNNTVRQYHSLSHDSKKANIIKKRAGDPHAVRTRNGEGEIYKTTLLVKMLCLAVNKISSLDPSGIGIEMEADKPGWCDSMNGLPGLFGSSTPEVFELKRQIVFLIDSLRKLGLQYDCKIKIPEEICDFLKKIKDIIKSAKSDFNYWDKANSIKEKYREDTRIGISGIEKSISVKELEDVLGVFLSKVNAAIKKAYIPSRKAYGTYFINEVTAFKQLNRRDPVRELHLVKPTRFNSRRLPLFLEGAVRAMKVERDAEKARRLYNALKRTGLYDKKLRMYRINESLDGISKEVGRSSVFTPGWLENESVWLHMEYKYLLEILKKGLYREFFEEFRNVLVPFQDPAVYGRSIFENSSFIVSSAFPDRKLHGRGFVARLSGSTAEMLSIWLLMNAGEKLFFLNEDDQLNLRFAPVLPSWLFAKNEQNGFPKSTYAFKFLGKTIVVYHNPKMKNTAGPNSAKPRFIILRYDDGRKVEIKKDIIPHPYARDIRDKKVEKIDIYLN